jgi:hypothetical protein
MNGRGRKDLPVSESGRDTGAAGDDTLAPRLDTLDGKTIYCLLFLSDNWTPSNSTNYLTLLEVSVSLDHISNLKEHYECSLKKKRGSKV